MLKREKLKERSLCIIFIVICTMGGILFNLVMDLLSERFSLSIDMTSEGIYQLSDQTNQVLSELDQPVTINILMDEADFSTRNFFAQVNELLLRYQAQGADKITLRYVDVYSNPGFVNAYPDETLEEGALIVESGSRYKVLTLDQLYQIQYHPSTGEAYIQGIEAEQKITSALLYAASSQMPTVCFLQGHGEQYSNRISALFEDAGYAVETVNLSTGRIPHQTSMLVMSGPTVDYSAKELEQLDAFFATGGDMIYFSNVYAGELPLLERYFEGWGVRFERSVILDQEYCLPGYPMQIYAALDEGEIADALASRITMPLLAPGCRPLALTGLTSAGWSVSPLLSSSSEAYSKPLEVLETGDALEQTKDDVQGPFLLATVSQHQISLTESYEQSRILFVSSHLITSDSLLSEPSWLNGPFLTECINFVGEQTDAVTVLPKQMSSAQLSLSNTEAVVVFWICVVALPALILMLGYFQWRKRRAK